MKKKILSLILVIALVLSCVFVLASCGGKDNEPDDGKPSDTDNTVPDVNVDENIGGGTGTNGVYAVTDPQSSEAGAESEGNYIHG